MRLIPLVALILLIAGCGGETKQPVQPVGVSGPKPQHATSTRPPSLFLESRAGRQQAVLGSYCVQGQLEGGCADSGPIRPTQLTVARSGEPVKFLLENARVRHPTDCVGAT